MKRLFWGPIVMLTIAGCAAVQLQHFQHRAERGDQAWIAARPVTCNSASQTCAQLHLIKGQACLQLAQADGHRTPAADYACAADEFSAGLALRPSWPDEADHRWVQESLCDALANLQALQSGAAAQQTLIRLEDAATELYRLAPHSIPAVYYLADARLRRIQPVLADLDPAGRIPVCNRLKRTLNLVLSVTATAAQAPSPQWEHYALRFQRLSFDLGVTIKTAGCR
jgi:hypothetical protein